MNEEKRSSIIRAAIEEFDRVGYEAANMDKISICANVSKATVYNHFGSKKDLFLALIEMLKKIVNEYTYIEYLSSKSIEQQLRDFAIQELEMVCNPYNMVLIRITITALMNECEVTPILKETLKDHFFENLIKWFNATKKDGRLYFDDAEFVTQQFIGNIKCFALYPQLYSGAKILPKEDWEKVISNAVGIVLKLYGTKL